MANSVIVITHTYKGKDGHLLTYLYLSELLALSEKSIHFEVHAFFYGFSESENQLIVELYGALQKTHHVSIYYTFNPIVYSEVPTLIYAIDIAERADPDRLVVYFHSKGASYEDQEVYRNWGVNSIAAIAAAIDVLLAGSKLTDLYRAFGSFSGIGVFERYGEMTPAFSGNFWLTTAKFLASRKFKKTWYSEALHNRHFAEALLGSHSSPELLLNLMGDYQLNSLSAPNTEKIYKTVSREMREFSLALDDEIEGVNTKIGTYYKILQEQQKRFSAGRYLWKMRKFLFGNQSLLRYFSWSSKCIDLVLPWSHSELYRHYNGPKHYDVFKLNQLTRQSIDEV